MLALEIELLTGTYRAALPDGSGAEWPPHPERVFSALVQAWADGGRDADERDALVWLERIGPPQIEAAPSTEVAWRDAPTVFVPPNDPRGDDLAVLPDRRRRQARRFLAASPAATTVRLLWPDDLPAARRPALDALAGRVASIGHSASLVRCRFTADAPPDVAKPWRPDPAGAVALRVPHAGRLDRLEGWHAADERPRGGATARYRRPGEATGTPVEASLFGGPDDWFVFESEARAPIDLLAFAHAARTIHKALLKHAGDPPPEALSGHAADRSATRRPHVAIVPLANVGFEHAGGDLLGFAVVLPRGLARDGEERAAVRAALERFAPPAADGALRAEVHLGRAGVWRVTHTDAPSRRSLRPRRWCATSDTWASATPVLLDRFPDHGDDAAAARLVAEACRNIGLPEPTEIELHKHPAVRGAPPAYPARDRRQPDWSFPAGAKFAQRPRRHVVLRFAAPVEGPVILGAGRFRGFGLCLPLAAQGAG